MRILLFRLLTILSFIGLSSQELKADAVQSGAPGTISTVALSGSVTSWSNLSNGASSDNQYVTIPTDALSSNGEYTDLLQFSNFGFNVDSNATIDGILVEIERGDINNAKDHRILIVKAGVAGTTDRSVTSAWSTESYFPYGSSTDLWGTTWTPADINNSGFGLAVAVKKQGNGANPTPQLDHVRITVYYSIPLPITLASFSAHCCNKGIVEINWKTVSEINNDYFLVERSVDKSEIEVIGRVQGAGTTTEPRHYFFTHSRPAIGISFYRIVQVDYDGMSEAFEWHAIKWTLENDGSFAVFPSPVPRRGRVNVKVPDFMADSECFLEIHDALGGLVWFQRATIESLVMALDPLPEGLLPGRYILSVKVKGTKLSKIIIVL